MKTKKQKINALLDIYKHLDCLSESFFLDGLTVQSEKILNARNAVANVLYDLDFSSWRQRKKNFQVEKCSSSLLLSNEKKQVKKQKSKL